MAGKLLIECELVTITGMHIGYFFRYWRRGQPCDPRSAYRSSHRTWQQLEREAPLPAGTQLITGY